MKQAHGAELLMNVYNCILRSKKEKIINIIN